MLLVLLPSDFLLDYNLVYLFQLIWIVLLPSDFLLDYNWADMADEMVIGFVTI